MADASVEAPLLFSFASISKLLMQVAGRQHQQDWELQVVLVATPDTQALLRGFASIPYNATVLGLYDPRRTDRQNPSEYSLSYVREYVRYAAAVLSSLLCAICHSFCALTISTHHHFFWTSALILFWVTCHRTR